MVELRRDQRVPDIELVKTPDEMPPARRRRTTPPWIGIAVALLVVAAAWAAYVVFRGPGTTRDAGVPTATAGTRPAIAQPLGGTAAAVVVPPLDESDPLVRTLVAQLSSHPRIAAWLATGGLIRNATVVITNVADGATPAVHLQVFRPPAPFSVVERGEGVYTDPRSSARYDSLVAALPSVDPGGAADLYATLKPRIEEAFQDLGSPGGSFDRALERAIVLLLETPVVDDPVRVEPHGLGYRFADPALEALTPAQKQLLRTGANNVRITQASLRKIALALGIPAERLPPVKN